MKAKWIGLAAVAGLMLWGGSDAWAQKKAGGSGSSSRSYSGGSTLYSQPATYTVGSTTYVHGEYYQTGYPKVQRRSAVGVNS